MKLTDKEISSVIKLSPLDRYKHALKNIAGQGYLYSIIDENDDYVIMGTYDAQPMVSIWPAKEYASRCIDTFGGTHIVEIDLDDFLEELIVFFKANSILINVFSVDSQSGFVVDWQEFKRDIEGELERYS